MKWNIALILAIAILAAGVYGITRMKNKGSKIFKPLNMLFITVYSAIFVLTVPVYLSEYSGQFFKWLKSVVVAAYTSGKVFLVDGELEIMSETIAQIGGVTGNIYTFIGSVLYVVAPALTFSFVLSFFKNLSAYKRFAASRKKDIYVFSCLSERSFVLAKDIMKGKEGRAVIFCSVDEDTDEVLMDKAGEIDAITFKNDITLVNLKMRNTEKHLYFFAIDEEEGANITSSLALIEKYRNEENTHLYTFTTGVTGELQLAAVNKGKMKVRRVDTVRSVINRILYDEGHKLFEGAIPQEDGTKKITAVVVGLGSYGMSMVKSLAWYCQMYGYTIEINGFDKDRTAYSRLCAECPELMDKRYNGVFVEGEGCYTININKGVDIGTKKFADKIMELKDATYVIVSIGDDEANVETAAYLRMLFERNGAKPVIQAIVHDSDKKRALTGIKNYRGQNYNIDFIGDLESVYSEDVILDSQLENDALGRHMKHSADEQTFWDYEYNYRSSIASAIHFKARQECGIIGMDKTEDTLTEEERDAIEPLEHMRWNVYMRSEGYIYSGSDDEKSRNDLGKMHHNLVVFDRLSDEDKRKDSRVGAR